MAGNFGRVTGKKLREIEHKASDSEMLAKLVLLVACGLVSGFAPLSRPAIPVRSLKGGHASLTRVAPEPQMIDFDTNTIVGLGAAFVGIFGGVGLIAFTEKAGTRERANDQPCVDCQGKQVVTCSICKGTGSDPLASLVAGVREMAGEDSPEKITVETWDSGPKQIIMYEEVLSRYPIKARPSPLISKQGPSSPGLRHPLAPQTRTCLAMRDRLELAAAPGDLSRSSARAAAGFRGQVRAVRRARRGRLRQLRWHWHPAALPGALLSGRLYGLRLASRSCWERYPRPRRVGAGTEARTRAPASYCECDLGHSRQDPAQRAGKRHEGRVPVPCIIYLCT